MEALSQTDIAMRLGAAIGFGALVGLERGYKRHRAGFRTHLLIALAASLFTIVSTEGFSGGDPSRVSAQIVSGIGFLGAGAILQLKAGARGLTTAASIWTAAGLGMAAGAGLYFLGAVASAMALVVLTLMRPISNWLAAVELHRSPLRRQPRSDLPNNP